MNYPAHVRLTDSGEQIEQSVQAHCRKCAEYAALSAPPELKQTAYLAGLLHDMGKFTQAFREYIFAGDAARRGSVNHTFAGVRYAMERWHKDDEMKQLTAEIIAFAVGSHHGQFDCISPDGTDGFLYRIMKEGINYCEAVENFLKLCASAEELDELFDASLCEIQVQFDKMKAFVQKRSDRQELCLLLAMLSRIILSSVIEGDRRDTAEFMGGEEMKLKQLEPKEWRSLLEAAESRIDALPAQTEINLARRKISLQCRAGAEKEHKIVRLSVPTGGGKTLATLRYSLAAAAVHKKKRIFFVIPLLSVLEQNAKDLKDYIQNNEIVLEHHSNIARELNSFEELDLNELMLESWQAPVVITTLVQFLHTLFAGKSSCIRRMNALSESVIIIDEVQSVPRNMISQFNLALNFLTEFCGATVVLCSATQPCLEKTKHFIQYDQAADLVPYDADLWNLFKRTKITDRRIVSGYSLEELSEFAAECARENGNLLLICNTKSQAREIYSLLQSKWSGKLFHLSTSMCMAHRVQTLDCIREALNRQEPILCVATQLVEAGIDVSFRCVIRLSAGMDNIIQAAGRCNRSGESKKLCPVYIVNIRDERLERLRDIRQSQHAAESVLICFQRQPEKFGNDLASEETIRAYYRNLYTDMAENSMDYPLPSYSSTMLEMLSFNANARRQCGDSARFRVLGQSFQTAGKEFKVFEDNTQDVIVPWGKEGDYLVSELGSERTKHDFAYCKQLIQNAARFSISLYEYELNRLKEKGGIYQCCEASVTVLREAFYSENTGVDFEGKNEPLKTC